MKLVHHFHEVPHLMDHAKRFRRVLPLDNLVQPAQAEPANGLTHVIGAANEADYPLDLDRAFGRAFGGGLFFCCHYSPAAFSAFLSRPVISSTVLVRVSAT